MKVSHHFSDTHEVTLNIPIYSKYPQQFITIASLFFRALLSALGAALLFCAVLLCS